MNVKALMTEMETEARAHREANRSKGWNGHSKRTFCGVVYCVRTSGEVSMLWTRDTKRISRKNVALQIAELTQDEVTS